MYHAIGVEGVGSSTHCITLMIDDTWYAVLADVETKIFKGAQQVVRSLKVGGGFQILDGAEIDSSSNEGKKVLAHIKTALNIDVRQLVENRNLAVPCNSWRVILLIFSMVEG